jgi:hypothetical protein
MFVASHIFISHSSKDQKVARTICTALENRGLTCWVYSRNIQPGQNFQEQIVRAIRAAKIMVLVFTANANSSNEIKKELAIASQNNLVVIPVRIEDVIPNEAFAYEFATRQWIDLFEDWESSIARLTELIASTSGDQPSGDQTKAGSGSTGDVAAPPVGKVVKTGPALTTGPASFMQQPGSRWAMILGAGVIVVAGIAYGVVTLRRQPASVSGTPTTGSPTPTQMERPAPAAAPTSNVPAVPAQPSVTEAAQAWMATKDTTSQAVLQDFIRQFGETPYGSMARARLQELQAAVPKQTDNTAVENPVAPPTRATNSCAAVVGGWDWFNGVVVVFKLDGTVRTTGNSGTWTCSNGNYVTTWSVGGWVDRFRISTDGTRIAGSNGTSHVSGIRK